MITAAPQRRNARKYFLPNESTNDPPPNEAARLDVLYQCNILDTPAEKEFDDIAHLAALICGTPIALIGFIDSNRQWFKSKVGWDKTSIRRDVALCTHTIRQKDVLIVPDTSIDQRFATIPLSLHNIKFYAGIPLITSDNQAVGTLCVIDHVSRQLNSSQVDALRTLGCQVVKLLELRRATEVKSTQIKQQSRRSRHFFTRIAAGFGLASAILLGSGLVWEGSLTDSIYDNDWQQNYQLLGDLKDLQSTLQKVSIANHYAKGVQANYIEPLDNINRKIDLKIDRLKQKTIKHPYINRRLSSLEPLIDRIQDGQTPNKTMGVKQVSQLLVQKKAIAHEIDEIVGEVENTQMLVRSQTQSTVAHSSVFTFSAGFCLCFLILTGVYYFTDQSIGDRKHAQAGKQITDTVIDTVGALIVVLDSQGKIIQINRFCEQITGYTRASVKGKYFWELFSMPSEAQIAKSNLSNLLDGQISNEYENFILTKDGDRRRIAWSNTTKRSRTGKVEYAILSGIDITPHLTTSSVLGSSEQHWGWAIDSLFTFVAVLTPSGILIEANQALLAAAKLQPKDVLGLPLTQTYWWSYSTEVQSQMQTAIERVSQGECVRYDIKGRVGENQFITIDFALTPMFDSAGKISYLIASGVDVTERKQLEAKRQQANEQLQDRLKELKQRNREITLLGKMNDVLQACLTVKEAYSTLAQIVQPLFPDSSGGIFINENNLVSVANWGSPVLADLKTFTPDDCWALRQGKPHLVDDTDNGLVCKHLHHTIPDQSLCVPIIAQSTSAGVLYLFSLEKGSITPAKQQLAYTVAEHIGLALANLKLRETLEHQSVRDPLTGLFNRRYMEESLVREMHRCDRKHQPLSLMMIDVDHFKRFNDTFGHAAGDAVLQELGKFLQKSVRACDIACRYGGEEFTLILPEASSSVTLERAEQIRTAIKQLNINCCGQSLGTLTVSIGIACFPDCGSAQALLKAADRALYQAKQQGRDQAIAAT